MSDCCPQQDTGAPQIYNFICVAGDDFYRELQFVDSVTAVPIDVTDWQFFGAIYASYAAKIAGTPPIAQFSNDSGFTMVDPVNGRIGMFLARAVTGSVPITAAPFGSDVPENICVYDTTGEDPGGYLRQELRGTFTFQMRLGVV